MGITHFTYMLNTHTHDDHIEGLIKLLRHGYTCGEYMSCYPDDYKAVTIKPRCGHGGDGYTFTPGGADITVFRDETPSIDKTGTASC